MRLLHRLGLGLAICAVAVLCMSSVTLAGVIGGVIALIVAIDMIAFSRSPPPPSKRRDKLNVDLTHRQ
jgi:hypothetical protein